MPTTSYVPPEILSSILDYLPFRALLTLRIVHKTFLHLINPRIFSNITIKLVRVRCDHKQLTLIKFFSTPSSPACSFANIVRKVILYTRRDYLRNEDNVLIDGKAFKAVISEDLATFLTSLQNLETVDWTHHVDQEPSPYFVPIAQSLSSLAKLRKLAINIQRGNDSAPIIKYMLPPLHTFKNLSSLSVSCCDHIPTAYCNSEISTALAASPKLTRFSLRNFDISGHTIRVNETCTSPQPLFGNATSPQLIQLELGRVHIPAAGLNQMLSHRLKALTISTPTRARPLNFAWAELFTTLEDIGVKLSQLSVARLGSGVDEMLSYLISYAGGLHTLEIRDIMMDSQDQENNSGYRFWHQIVPHHKDSLRTLLIHPWYEGEWCYGPETAAAIRQCLSLQNLGLAVRSVDSAWAKAKRSLSSANDPIKYLDLREPLGLPENSAALILSDFSYPFAKVALTFADEGSTRAEDILSLHHGVFMEGPHFIE
ncbi:hypothetical protein MMC31_004069 [Peltigera leucophlebia]|nr:hypothetical protein [Peltigera leucophlebia]